eukprot:8268696-Pyramimonas_sp.AAC.1
MEQDWIQKAKAEPQKEHKHPTHWGPYERLYCAPEAHTRSASRTRTRRRSKGCKPTKCSRPGRQSKASS